MSLVLPEPVAAYFAAENRDDTEALAHVSADDRSTLNTEIGSPLTSEENVPSPMTAIEGGTDAEEGGFYGDSGTGATWRLSM